MAIIDKTTDFVGEYNVPQNSKDHLDTYIAKFEEMYLTQLLGAELYALFIADLSGSPQVPGTPRFVSIFDPFSVDEGGCVIVSKGIRQMLTKFVYFHFARDLEFKVTASGGSMASRELGTGRNYIGYNLVEAFNSAVNDACAIQWFIGDNSSDYPEENIQIISLMSGI